MATQLTDRQQEIKRLLSQGMTPREVGDALGISENAVYQARTRIRKATGSRRSSGARKPAARRTSGRKSRASTRRPARTTPRAGLLAPGGNSGNSVTTPPAHPLTPLQAIRHRKSEIEAELKEAQVTVTSAEKAHEHAKAAYEKVQSSHSAELIQLEAAEAALTGAKPKAKAKSKRASAKRTTRRNGKAAQAAPAAPSGDALAPPTPDPEAETALAAAQAASATANGDEARAAQVAEPTPDRKQTEPTPEPAAVAAGDEGFTQPDGFGEE